MKRIIVLFSIVLLVVPFAAVAQDFCDGNFDYDKVWTINPQNDFLKLFPDLYEQILEFIPYSDIWFSPVSTLLTPRRVPPNHPLYARRPIPRAPRVPRHHLRHRRRHSRLCGGAGVLRVRRRQPATAQGRARLDLRCIALRARRRGNLWRGVGVC